MVRVETERCLHWRTAVVASLEITHGAHSAAVFLPVEVGSPDGCGRRWAAAAAESESVAFMTVSMWMMVLVLVFEGDEIGAEKDNSGRAALNVVLSFKRSGDVVHGPSFSWLRRSSG